MSQIAEVIPVRPEPESRSGQLEAGGACARCAGSREKPLLQVFSRRNELLFEYDPVEEKARIVIARGDLQLATRAGDISLDAAGDLKLAGQRITLCGKQKVDLSVADEAGLLRSAISLGSRAIKLQTHELGLLARRCGFNLEQARYTGSRIRIQLDQARLTARRLQTTVDSLVEKARNAYRKVEELSQLQAGRVRTLVEGTYQRASRTALVKADGDYKVRADQIHLG